MDALCTARRTLEAVDLVSGLSTLEVQERLRTGLRLHDTGQRILAFYLVEMQANDLYQDSGHASAIHYAEDRLGMDRRRAGELLAVGRALLTLPAIDAAFCEGRIPWSSAVRVARVATSDCEETWLRYALEMTVRELERAVRLSKRGESPRAPGDMKGLPEIRFRVNASVGVLAHQKLERAKEMLSAERGEPVNDALLLEVLAEAFLATEDDGSVPGRVRVDSSLYRIVVRPADDGGDGPGRRLLADSEIGPLPIDEDERADDSSPDGLHSACVHCDAECVGAGDEAIDPQTPTPLRRRILARDGYRCRCCGGRSQVQVHHIEERAKGGRTRAFNLVTICLRCHALVHAGLLRIEGDPRDSVRFLDATGALLNEGAPTVAVERLLALGRGAQPPLPEPLPRTPLTLDTLPDEIDGGWWQRHAAWIRFRPGRGLELRAGGSIVEGGDQGRAARAAGRKTLAGLVGQDALVERLERTAASRRRRGRPFPHTLLEGPPGTGKTTIARGIAELLGGRSHATAGPLLTDVHALVRVLASLADGDVLFLDEVHAVGRSILEVLYEALEEGRLSLPLHAGARARCLVLRLPAFTLVAATTEGGTLPEALRSRFGLREALRRYRVADLATVVEAAAARDDLVVERDAARRIARCARGAPREALRLLELVTDACEADRVECASTHAVLAELGYDDTGLGRLDREYLRVLRHHGAPVSIGLLARTLGTSVGALMRDVEPLLVQSGHVRITRQGRVAG